MKKFFIILPAIYILITGCTGIGIYQPPRTLDKGESLAGLGTPVTYTSFRSSEKNNLDKNGDSI